MWRQSLASQRARTTAATSARRLLLPQHPRAAMASLPASFQRRQQHQQLLLLSSCRPYVTTTGRTDDARATWKTKPKTTSGPFSRAPVVVAASLPGPSRPAWHTPPVPDFSFSSYSSASFSSASYSWQQLWEFSKDQLPKGLQDFFPPGAKAPPPTPGAEAASTTTDGPRMEAASSDDDKKEEDNHSNKRQKKESPPPPPLEDTGNIPGLLALLALIVALRSALDEQQKELGQEITFMDFKRTLLQTGQVAKLVIVNKSLAKVVLRPDALVDEGGNANALPRSGSSPTPEMSLHDGGVTEGMHSNITSTTFEGGNRALSVTPAAYTKVGHKAAPTPFYFYIGSVEALEEKLTKAQQNWHPQDWVEVQYVTHTNWALELLKFLPLLAFVAAVYFGTRGSGLGGIRGAGGGAGGGSNIFSIGKSPAKKIKKEDVDVTFANVAGVTQAKLEIMEFVDFLKDSSRFEKLGAKIPKGALLCGPPGTGKTLLAKAVAGEAGVPFYSISGSDFIEMFVGVGPSRVRDLFKEARANAPCIVFIDEIDAVGRQRGRGGFSGGGNDERENTLNQLLVEMDGFLPSTGVVVLAGTNRVDILDSALTRPGRFDRQITVDRPDLQGRKEIFQVHLKGITLESPVDEIAGRLAGLTPGFAGADIANLCNEAAIVGARRKAETVSLDDFEKATDRIIGGLESHKIMSAHEKKVVAHHEAGHAVAGWFLEHADPLLKVTIIPRTSGALGFAQYLPKEVFLRNRDQIMDVVCMALAGRAAEKVFFGEVTTGASDDLRRVTQMVYSTIKDFGMNTRLGKLSFPNNENAGPGDKLYSESTAEAMDEEARAIVDAAYQRTVDLITEHKEDVLKVANLLLDRETITHDDMIDLIGERPFVGDPAYEEYVRRKKPPTATSEPEEKSSDESETKAHTPLGADLTPGLA